MIYRALVIMLLVVIIFLLYCIYAEFSIMNYNYLSDEGYKAGFEWFLENKG